MTPYYEQDGITIYHGDCREVLPSLSHVDLVVTSPPYAEQRSYGSTCGFDWDSVVPPSLAMVPLAPNGQVLVYVDEFAFRLNDGNVKRHTIERLDSMVLATAGKRLTYQGLIQ